MQLQLFLTIVLIATLIFTICYYIKTEAMSTLKMSVSKLQNIPVTGRKQNFTVPCESANISQEYFLSRPAYKELIKMHPGHKKKLNRIVNKFKSASTTSCQSLKSFKKVLLAINFNFPHYNATRLLMEFYGPVFGKVIFCGKEDSIEHGVIKINEHSGWLGYECIATAIRRFPNFDGYIHSNDDVIFNWWNAVNFDQRKIWSGVNLLHRKYEYHIFGTTPPSWHWWTDAKAAENCEKAFEEILFLQNRKEGQELGLSSHIKQYYMNTRNRHLCMHTWSDFFYIPGHLSSVYAKLSEIFSKHEVFLEVAVPTLLFFLANGTNHLNLRGMYYLEHFGYSKMYLSGEAFYRTYSLNLNFSHPFKFDHNNMGRLNRKFYNDVIVSYGCKIRTNCVS